MLPINQKTEEAGSIFGAILNRINITNKTGWNLLICLEAIIVVIVSVFICQTLNIPETGLMSLAFVSAAVVPRVNQILQINRERIWSEPGSGWSANRESLISGVSIFVGMFVGFLLVAIITDTSELLENFKFVLGSYEGEGKIEFTPERFDKGISFVQNNFMVLCLFFLIGFFYRALGATLALGWNAGVWAVTIVLATKYGMQDSAEPLYYSLIIALALTPHIILEALSYLTASLSAIFLSRGIILYQANDIRLRRVLAAVIVLFVVAVLFVIIAAIVEGNFAPYILEFNQ
tara:strand:- start:6 stop:878 length:873 start_codon:yes stop_codon:yes gene_type:complete